MKSRSRMWAYGTIVVAIALLVLAFQWPQKPQPQAAGSVKHAAPENELGKQDEFTLEHDNKHTPAELQKQLDERVALWEPWYVQAKNITEFTKDPLAQEVLAFMETHGGLASPEAAGPRLLQPVTDEGWYLIIPLKQEDAKIAGSWKDLLSTPAGGNFVPGMRALIIRQYKVGPVWRGIMTLHEGLHAYRYMTEAYDWKDQKIFCYKEVEAHNFQNRLMMKIGEDRYAKLIDEEVQKMKTKIEKDGGTIGDNFPDRAEKYPMLDVLFMPSESRIEEDMRCTHVWLHICFELIDRHFKGDKENQKALFLRVIYDQANILPQKK